MAIRRIDPELISAQRIEFIYTDEDYGIKASDGAVLVFRPLSKAESDEFSVEMQKYVKVKTRSSVKGRKGKGDGVEYSTDVNTEGMQKVTLDRIKASLCGWSGFVEFLEVEGEWVEKEIPYSWEEFLKMASVYHSLVDFADECVDDAYSRAIASLDGHAKN